MTVPTRGAEDTRAVARALAGQLRAGDLLVLDGPLGAGKTTFTQGLGDGLGVRGPVASPTFVIARVHPPVTGELALVHVDAYRLAGGFDIEDLDLEADMDEAVTVVEWGRDRVEHLTDSHLLVELHRAEEHAGAAPEGTDAEDAEVDLSRAGDEQRHLRVTAVGPRWDGAEREALRRALTGAVEPAPSQEED
ncbi:tRNA (adenosine(37)-N6)-threonylcarbamoyltransferase complex ATPase subunit type 1 TsaE [Brachybacterium sp. EF45031]|nr:tRNA (adenosine(37)-N6)-threonylcarbamoyltransferase complex ATPase subunit type 1 TsaE [Brachybacterium sillae]